MTKAMSAWRRKAKQSLRLRYAAQAVVILFAINGCAPTNSNTLRTDPGRSLKFESRLDYQTVYANEQRAFLKCMTGSHFRMTFAIQPRIEPEKKTASITYVHNGAWRDYWAVLDMRAVGNGTSVDVYTTSHSNMDGFLRLVEKWAAGSDECPEATPVYRNYPLVE